MIMRLLILCGALSFVCGCTGEGGVKTKRPYLFVDSSGKEYRGFYTQPNLPKPVVGKSGHLTVSYENGQKWIEGHLTNGQFHGTVKMWRQDGVLFMEENYQHGLKHGKLTWWHDNGKKQMQVDWVNNKKEGLWIEWDVNGNETSRRQFENDKPVE